MDLARALCLRRPVGHHDAAPAVGDQQHRAVDGGYRFLQRTHAGAAIEVGAAHGRDAARLRQFLRQQGLPVLGHVVTQARDDQDGGANRGVHRE